MVFLLLLSGFTFFTMSQESIRKRIVSLSKGLAESTDYNEIKKIRRQIASLKGSYKTSDPKSISDLITGK